LPCTYRWVAYMLLPVRFCLTMPPLPRDGWWRHLSILVFIFILKITPQSVNLYLECFFFFRRFKVQEFVVIAIFIMIENQNPSTGPTNSHPGTSSQSTRRRRRGVEIIGYGNSPISPPRPVNLLCTIGLTYEPLWTLWTLWTGTPKPKDPTCIITTVDDYANPVYDKIRKFEPNFEIPEDEDGDIIVVCFQLIAIQVHLKYIDGNYISF